MSEIVPTRVGVNRAYLVGVSRRSDCPHARGGEPFSSGSVRCVHELSPRAWG